MKRVTCQVQVGVHEFRNVVEVKINSSYENLTDTATITIPQKLSFKGTAVAGDGGVFKVGDTVKIYLGYDFENTLVFSGFVTAIKPGKPVVISCEDQMYALKKNAISKSWTEAVTLQQFLEEIVPDYPVHCVGANLGKPRMNGTPAGKLNELNRDYSMKSFFRDGTLYVGLAYWLDLQNTNPPKFGFNTNIITHDLQWQRLEDVKVKVKAISVLPDNSKLEEVVGDSDGALRTLTYYNMNKKDLREAATRDLQRFRFSGVKGSFKTFGTPVVFHGDRIELIDPAVKDRNGLYIVKSVERTFGVSGYRQNIELEAKV